MYAISYKAAFVSRNISTKNIRFGDIINCRPSQPKELQSVHTMIYSYYCMTILAISVIYPILLQLILFCCYYFTITILLYYYDIAFLLCYYVITTFDILLVAGGIYPFSRVITHMPDNSGLMHEDVFPPQHIHLLQISTRNRATAGIQGIPRDFADLR